MWSAQTTSARFFLIYLAVVFGVVLVRGVRLGWRLGLRPSRKAISLKSIIDGDFCPDLLAESALALPSRLLTGKDSSNKGVIPSEQRVMVLNVIRRADTKFLHLWEVMRIEVHSLRRLLHLTLLLSLCGYTVRCLPDIS